MRVVAFANGKGGAGKTTSAVNVSAGLARKGYKTVLLDADAFTWRASWWAESEDGTSKVEFDFAKLADTRQLGTVLKTLKSRAVEIVLIDTPPAVHSEWVWSVLNASDLVVVPSKTTMLDLSMAIETARRASKETATRLLLTQVDPHSLAEAYAALSTLKATGLDVYATPVRQYKAHERAAAEHLSVFAYEGSVELTKPRRDYGRVVEETLASLRLPVQEARTA